MGSSFYKSKITRIKCLSFIHLLLYISIVSPVCSDNVQTNSNIMSNSIDRNGDYDHSWERDTSFGAPAAAAAAVVSSVPSSGTIYSTSQGQNQGAFGGGVQTGAPLQSSYSYGVPPPVQQPPATMSTYGAGNQAQPMVFYYQNMPNPPMMMPASMMMNDSKKSGLLNILMSILGLLGSSASGLTSMLGLLGLSGLSGLNGLKGLVGLAGLKGLLALPLLLPILLPLTLIAALPFLLLLLVPVPVITIGRKDQQRRSVDLDYMLNPTSTPNLLSRITEATLGHQNAHDNNDVGNTYNSSLITYSGMKDEEETFRSNSDQYPNHWTTLVSKGYTKLFKSVISSTDCVERISCELIRVARNYKQLESLTNMITHKLSFVSSTLVEKMNEATKSGIKCKRFKCMGWLF